MKYYLIVVLVGLYGQLCAQQTFQGFLRVFPLYIWNELPEDVRDLKVPGNKLDANIVNLYIYTDKYQGEERPVRNNQTRKPPLRMAWDGIYFNGDEEGRYSNKSVVNVDGTDRTISYQIYPLGRVQVNDSICMILLLYDGPGAGDNYLEKNLYYEVYTFNTKREKVLSSLTLFRDSKLFFAYIHPNRDIYVYQDYEYSKGTDDDYEEVSTIAKRVYHLRNDGFFQLTDNEFLAEKRRIAEFVVIDKDGYSNVREQPTTQSRILYTIKTGLGGILEITDDPNWYKIIYSDDGGIMPDKNANIKGWIHKSRVCFYPGNYGWEKGDTDYEICR